MTTGRGTERSTALARPGPGLPATGEASQLAGSFAGHVTLTRSSERPRYWKLDEFSPVHSSSAPSPAALMAHGNSDEKLTESTVLSAASRNRTVPPPLLSWPS